MPSQYRQRRDRTPERLVLDDDEVKLLRRSQVELLTEFDRVCTALGLEYFAMYGTLLGAVRHGGFIPWDDDVDVGMVRADYERLVAQIDRELGDKFTFQTYDSDPHSGYFFGKLRMNGTRCVDEMTWDSAQHGGVFIDVFPIDVQAPPGWRRLVQKGLRYNGMRLLFLKADYLFMLGTSRRDRVAQAFVRAVARLLPRSFVIALTNWYTRLGGTGVPEYYTSLFGAYPYERDVVAAEWIHPLQRIAFEDVTIPAFADTDAYLTRVYGNYLELPPPEQRVGHHEIVELDLG